MTTAVSTKLTEAERRKLRIAAAEAVVGKSPHDLSTREGRRAELARLEAIIRRNLGPVRPSTGRGPVTGKSDLYRCFAADGSLLYVGISLQAPERLAQHRGGYWWDEVARVTVEHFPTRALARAAEHAAIISENPIHNLRD